MMKNIKVDNHQLISRLIYANNALFLQTWDAPNKNEIPTNNNLSIGFLVVVLIRQIFLRRYLL